MTDRLDVTESHGLHNPADAGSGEALAAPHPDPPNISTDPSKNAKVRIGDRIFRGLAEGSGVLIVVIIAAIGAFLLLVGRGHVRPGWRRSAGSSQHAGNDLLRIHRGQIGLG